MLEKLSQIENYKNKNTDQLFDIKELPEIRCADKDSYNKIDLEIPSIETLPPINTLLNIDEKKDKPFIVNALPQNGDWTGEKGDSTWKPDRETTPDPENKKGGNPDNQTWDKILDKYGIDGIEFRNGYPDFSNVSVGETKVEPFTDSRDKNFRQADEKLAEQWSNEKKDGKEWTARNVAEWRKENGYTWHECEDCKTMQLVPKEIHNNTPHSGGISEIKKQQENL